MTIIESLFTAYFIYAVVIVATEGWGSPLTTEFLFYALMVGTIFVATPCIGIEVAITLHVIALCFLLMINPEIPARLEENTFQADTLPRLVAGILLHIFRPFMPPRTMTALLVCFGTLWICLVLATMLDIDLDMTSLLGLATLSVVVWRSWEDDGVKAWRDSPRRFEV